MGVSKNRGTPKSSILIGFSIINHPFWGTPIFGNTQMYANHVETLWIQVLYLLRRYFTPPNCTLSAFLEATWIHREKSVGVYFFLVILLDLPLPKDASGKWWFDKKDFRYTACNNPGGSKPTSWVAHYEPTWMSQEDSKWLITRL